MCSRYPQTIYTVDFASRRRQLEPSRYLNQHGFVNGNPSFFFKSFSSFQYGSKKAMKLSISIAIFARFGMVSTAYRTIQQLNIFHQWFYFMNTPYITKMIKFRPYFIQNTNNFNSAENSSKLCKIANLSKDDSH